MPTIQKPTGPITKFEGTYGFLSLEFPCEIMYNGETYSSAAVLFYAMRAENKNSRRKIMNLSSNKARQKSAALPPNPDYDENREYYLEEACRAKFESNTTLKAWLIKTAPVKLINTVTHRDTWIGVKADGKGSNMLGKVLMKIRDEYLASKSA